MTTLRNITILFLVLSSAALASPASDIVGVWQSKSGSSLELTKDGKWIFHGGPMQLNLTYTVTKTDGKSVVVLVRAPNNPKDGSNVTMTVSGSTLTTTSDSKAWNGTWTRKK